ncbi:uncharacterized protein N7496_008724 [Penicillium cataractarum]|uniref:Uncharacterized protein n=1 Tax=Penicillium cataractarum TaxID=2100454 RepID=A0A9W9V600_9EURO|nr:uncharacterized protein N7496_008724 [Penicillium cataractarum]KAJ5368964.1 hypothetical protein N7496_008724 [Penicillium cataractarum]
MDTFKLKIEFAQKTCLGGVDTEEGLNRHDQRPCWVGTPGQTDQVVLLQGEDDVVTTTSKISQFALILVTEKAN